MNKKDVIAQILSEYQSRLARLPEERERMLAEATPENRPFIEQAFDGQQRSLQGILEELYRIIPAASTRHASVSEGSLIKAVLGLINGETQQEWWMVLSCVYGKLGAVKAGDEPVFIQGADIFSVSLLGRRPGDRFEYPRLHGDGRDRIDHVTIKEVL
jgi:hypothetical protein